MSLKVTLPLLSSVFMLLAIGCGPAPQPVPKKGSATPSPTAAAQSADAAITVGDWGPRQTSLSQGFNVQPNGDSAMFVQVKGLRVDPKNYITFGGLRISGLTQTTNLVTFAVPKSIYSTVGDKSIVLHEASSGRSVNVGIFKVQSSAKPLSTTSDSPSSARSDSTASFETGLSTNSPVRGNW